MIDTPAFRAGQACGLALALDLIGLESDPRKLQNFLLECAIERTDPTNPSVLRVRLVRERDDLVRKAGT